MTTIRLGVGEDAVEVEDGARVPIKARDWKPGDRLWGTLRMLDGVPVIKFAASAFSVALDTGATAHMDGWRVDLDALRRERAPTRVVGGWCNHNSQVACQELCPDRPSQLINTNGYWRYRSGAGPAEWDAFDRAIDAWVNRLRDHVNGPCTNPETTEMWNAARALGYGRR